MAVYFRFTAGKTSHKQTTNIYGADIFGAGESVLRRGVCCAFVKVISVSQQILAFGGAVFLIEKFTCYRNNERLR